MRVMSVTMNKRVFDIFNFTKPKPKKLKSNSDNDSDT